MNLLKKPSAWIPILMSFLALSILIGHILIFGIDIKQEKDEGTEAHLFQLLIAGEIPIIAFFMIKYLPKKTKEALLILLLQDVFLSLFFSSLKRYTLYNFSKSLANTTKHHPIFFAYIFHNN